MKKKTLVSSILAIVLCLGLIAGTTYALFTSEDNVNIAVNSGKVSVTATVTDLVTYSMGEVTANNGTFANGGTAVFAPVEGVKTLSLTNVTPGDKVTFTIELTNASTIDIQYRLIWNISGALSEALEINASNLDWTQWATSEEATKEIGVTVELPADFETQGLADATISFTVEAVQANAIAKDVATADQLWTALKMGVENITLTQDITLDSDQVITVAEGATATISLNGNKLIGTAHKNVGAVIKNNGTLTITGGTISSTAANGGSAIQNNGTLTVNNATLNGASNADGDWPSYTVNNTGVMTVNNSTITSVHGAVASYGAGAVLTLNNTNIDMSGIPGFTSHGIYTYNDGQVIVNDGNIANNAADQNATGASVINGNVIVNSGNFTGRIENYYGTPVIYGGTFSVKPKANFVATGYEAKESNSQWYVVPVESGEIVTDADSLIENLESGNDVFFMEDVKIEPAGMSNSYGTTGINVNNGQTIDGNGNILDIKGAGGTWDSGICTSGGLVKNITVTGSFRGIFIKNNTEKVVLENVIIEGTTYTISCDQGSGAGLEATDSTFKGWTSYAATLGDAKFVDCYFGAGNGYSYCRPYAPTTFVGCTFEEGYTINPRANIVLVDCYYGETLITEENIESLDLISGDMTKVAFPASVSGNVNLGDVIANNGGYADLAGDVQYGNKILGDVNLNLNENAFEATNTIELSNNSNLAMSNGDYVVNGTYGHVDVRPDSAEGSVVTFENVDFSYNKKGPSYGSSTDRLGSVVEVCATVEGAKTVIVFRNCTFDNAQVLFEGLSGKIGEFEATFENCTFNALTSSAPIYVQNYVKGTINVIGCTFNLECTSSTASAISVSPSSSTSVVVNAKDNTINATAATPTDSSVTGVDVVKVNGTPANIKFVSISGTTSTANEVNTTKTGIAG